MFRWRWGVRLARLRAWPLAAAGLLLSVYPATSSSGAAGLPPVPGAAGLARLSSYAVQVQARSRGALAATVAQTAVVLRGGQAIDLVTATRPEGAGETTVAEEVVQGAQVCERAAFNAPLPLTGAFTCRRAPAEGAAALRRLAPLTDLLPAATPYAYRYRRIGTVRPQGVRCVAYAYDAAAPRAVERGTLSLAPLSGVPCREEATTRGVPLIGLGPSGPPRGTAVTSAVVTWSRFNDPTLRVPAVPGA